MAQWPHQRPVMELPVTAEPIPTLLAVDDPVQWTSRGGSGRSTKRGRVIVVVPPGTDIDAFKRDLAASHDLSPVMLCGQPRHTRSYLVEVQTASGRKPKLYWPRAEHLTRLAATLPPRTQLTTQARQMGLFPGGHVRRLLVSGREVVESDVPVAITINTRAPGKWALVDLETGAVWESLDGRKVKRAAPAVIDDLLAAIRAPRELVRGLHARRRAKPGTNQPG